MAHHAFRSEDRLPAALVTGASTGIGLEITRYLTARGWTVYAGVRKDSDADKIRSLPGGLAVPVFLDVTQPDSIRSALNTIREQDGCGLDGLVNNAGIAIAGPLEFLAMEDLRYQIEVNFLGQIAVTQHALPLLREQRGRVINMSSISGRVAMPFMGPYTTSKFALEAFSDSLRLELRPWNMYVSLIEPGAVATPIWEKSVEAAEERLRRLPPEAHRLYGVHIRSMLEKITATGEHGVSAERVAEAVFQALTVRRPKARYYVGFSTRLVATLVRLAPDRLRDWVIARLTGFDRKAVEME